MRRGAVAVHTRGAFSPWLPAAFKSQWHVSRRSVHVGSARRDPWPPTSVLQPPLGAQFDLSSGPMDFGSVDSTGPSSAPAAAEKGSMYDDPTAFDDEFEHMSAGGARRRPPRVLDDDDDAASALPVTTRLMEPSSSSTASLDWADVLGVDGKQNPSTTTTTSSPWLQQSPPPRLSSASVDRESDANVEAGASTSAGSSVFEDDALLLDEMQPTSDRLAADTFIKAERRGGALLKASSTNQFKDEANVDGGDDGDQEDDELVAEAEEEMLIPPDLMPPVPTAAGVSNQRTSLADAGGGSAAGEDAQVSDEDSVFDVEMEIVGGSLVDSKRRAAAGSAPPRAVSAAAAAAGSSSSDHRTGAASTRAPPPPARGAAMQTPRPLVFRR